MFKFKLILSITFVFLSMLFLGNVITGHYIANDCCVGGPDCNIEDICQGGNQLSEMEMWYYGVFSIILLIIAFAVYHNHIH